MAKEKDAVPAAKEGKDERSKALKAFMEVAHKKHGDGELLIMGNEKRAVVVDVISTGSISLDSALGIGGMPRGRIVEIFGPEASGKTTTTLSIIAEAQKKGLACGFVDAEQALDVSYAKKLGVKFDDSLMYCQPNSGEQALQIVKEMCESGLFGCIVVDSVAALTPQKEIDGEIEDQSMGLQARMMGKAMRVLTAPVSKNNVLLVFINQIREKIGVMYGDPTTTTGGKALPFYASVRLRVSKMGGKDDKLEVDLAGEKEGDPTRRVSGYKMKVMIKKNKMSAPHEEVQIPILFGVGIYAPLDIFSAGVETEVIKIEGRTHTFGDRVLGKSSADALKAIQDDVKLQKEIEKALRARL